jgi:hypothetical protein
MLERSKQAHNFLLTTLQKFVAGRHYMMVIHLLSEDAMDGQSAIAAVQSLKLAKTRADDARRALQANAMIAKRQKVSCVRD